MIKSETHKYIIQNMNALCAWYENQKQSLNVPIYSSFDIRDSGEKIVNVDGNIFPAGFNNICPTDQETSVEIVHNYLKKKYGSKAQRILLITEEHTANVYYWDNVYMIKSLIEQTGRKVMVSLPRRLDSPLNIISASQRSVEVFSGFIDDPKVKEFAPDLIVSNNDFSNKYEEWIENIRSLSINPPYGLGWHSRKKSNYFKFYNQLAEEFAEVIKMDAGHFTVETELFSPFDINSESSRNELAVVVDKMLARLNKKKENGEAADSSFVFIKNNSGTYGLGVAKATSGIEVSEWTYKMRKKMKAAKGGRAIEEVIVQEGVPSIVQADGATAEPVIYMIGCDLAGGFLRSHAEKSDTESLNSPGAVYKRLCVTDLLLDTSGCVNENVYGWVGKLGLLAIAKEAQEMGIDF